MQLYVSKPSPYARKAWAAVHELGLADRVAIVELPGRMPTVAKPDLDAVNPLGKVPALVTAAGELICDSPVIVAYLDALAGHRLIPADADRWSALTLEAIADGIMDAGVVVRIEQLKDAPDAETIDAHRDKIGRALDFVETRPRWLDHDVTVGHLALACAVEWLAFREILPDPIHDRLRLAAWHSDIRDRPALAATRPG